VDGAPLGAWQTAYSAVAALLFGIDCKTAHNGAEALQALQKANPQQYAD